MTVRARYPSGSTRIYSALPHPSFGTEIGRPPGVLANDVVAGSFDELTRAREKLNSRYDDLKSGRFKPIDGETFFESFRRREDELLKKQ